MDMQELVPLYLHEELRQLGKLRWLAIKNGLRRPDDDRPRTYLDIQYELLHASSIGRGGVVRAIERMVSKEKGSSVPGVLAIEALAYAFATGPKLFCPSPEQFEAMEQVELRLPVADFRSPYPMLFIRVPNESRKRLADTLGYDHGEMPKFVSVRWRKEPEDDSTSITCSESFSGRMEMHQTFSDQVGNHSLETAILRRIYKAGEEGDTETMAQFQLGEILCRTALNLCLMLAHYGYKDGGPHDPRAYAKHRTRKHLAHFAHGDFTTVQMRQDIRIRAPSPVADNPPGPGTGAELRPHWRRGHWRAYPGQGAKRAAGEKVPLLFIRPCVVRRDRAVGDLADSQVVYHGD